MGAVTQGLLSTVAVIGLRGWPGIKTTLGLLFFWKGRVTGITALTSSEQRYKHRSDKTREQRVRPAMLDRAAFQKKTFAFATRSHLVLKGSSLHETLSGLFLFTA
jgi:hypothetical protein